ncbi:electron transfer flavoprotein-ubiquinone oxidoreductase [Cucumibacter marinus]|uniref:electron transfer flavoprotein-ubiquinone oxidoreductase n=1 Tax=Cucumibacter marinus TaxID=1121252 RepID=UPI00040F5248|nr:electron transfer flavoprotein-ubiquinone oxidoreductase [Cucumibacter marinus]
MDTPERESMDYDVVIVGAGPAGLSAAIRLKQLGGDDLSVCVLEKGAEVGAHILSGAVLDPSGLDALIPDWREKGAPITTEVKEDKFLVLSEKGKMGLPTFLMPPLMSNHGAYIVSMGNVCRWLAEQAEALGVEIFPGMAASALVMGEDGGLKGVVAGEFGLSKDGTPGPNYEPGINLIGKYVLIGEGARGSLAKQLIANFGLAADSDPQKFGLGIKEIWRVKPENHHPGRVVHTMGWPLNTGDAGGGGFLYHAENNEVYVGLVVHLDYKNPYVSPYQEMQRYKHHPEIAKVLEGGERVAYGARTIAQGGWQALPKVIFPGGALIGCSAGLVNVPRIKGNHNAMHSGMAAAEAVTEAIKAGRSGDELAVYAQKLADGPVGRDLKPVRNVKPLWSRFGEIAGVALAGFDMWCANLFKFNPFGTLHHLKNDAQSTGKAADYKKIDYPKPDGVLSFDRSTNVAFSGTNHDEDEPTHLKLTDPLIPIAVNLPEYDEPAQRYCPAGVYEVIEGEDGKPRFQINGQNCVHCKACDIKDPSQNITWTVPQGGSGPTYPNM